MNTQPNEQPLPRTFSRREVLLGLFTLAAAAALPGCSAQDKEALRVFVHANFKEMSPEELKEILAVWENAMRRRMASRCQ